MRKLESSLRAAEEEVSRTRREAEKKIKKMSLAVVPATTREEALTQENEGLWVRCSLPTRHPKQTIELLLSENREMHDVQARHA